MRKSFLWVLPVVFLLFSGCTTKKNEHVYVHLHNVCEQPKLAVNITYVRADKENKLYITTDEATSMLKMALMDSRCFIINSGNSMNNVANLDLLYSSKIMREYSPNGVFSKEAKLFLSVDAKVSIENRDGRKTHRATSLIELRNLKIFGLGEDPVLPEDERIRAIDLAIRNAIKEASRALL